MEQSLRVWAVKKRSSSKPSTFHHLRAMGGFPNRLPVRRSSDSRGGSPLKLRGVAPLPQQMMSSPLGWRAGKAPEGPAQPAAASASPPSTTGELQWFRQVTPQPPQIQAAMLQGSFQKEPEQEAGHNRSGLVSPSGLSNPGIPWYKTGPVNTAFSTACNASPQPDSSARARQARVAREDSLLGGFALNRALQRPSLTSGTESQDCSKGLKSRSPCASCTTPPQAGGERNRNPSITHRGCSSLSQGAVAYTGERRARRAMRNPAAPSSSLGSCQHAAQDHCELKLHIGVCAEKLVLWPKTT